MMYGKRFGPQSQVHKNIKYCVCAVTDESVQMFFLLTGIMSWYYYVTMPMPASTFTIAVGCWQEVKQSFTPAVQTNNEFSLPCSQADFRLVFRLLLKNGIYA